MVVDSIFKMHFFEWKWQNSDSTEICSQESKWQYVSMSSDIGLAPNRWQTIAWANAGPVPWCIYAALGGDELTNGFTVQLQWQLSYTDVAQMV